MTAKGRQDIEQRARGHQHADIMSFKLRQQGKRVHHAGMIADNQQRRTRRYIGLADSAHPGRPLQQRPAAGRRESGVLDTAVEVGESRGHYIHRPMDIPIQQP